jgi:hypothetical protein
LEEKKEKKAKEMKLNSLLAFLRKRTLDKKEQQDFRLHINRYKYKKPVIVECHCLKA